MNRFGPISRLSRRAASLALAAFAAIAKGATQTVTVTGHFSDGSTRTITSSVTWTSSDPTVARINAGKKGGAGKALGISPGTVTITATKPPSGGQPAVSGSTSLTVK